jgi:hypothetical protein
MTSACEATTRVLPGTAEFDAGDHRSGPGADAGQRPALRDLHDRGRAPQGRQVLGAATLTALGQRFGVADPKVEIRSTCVDSKRQWRHARNVWHNSMVRSMLQTLAAPVTGLRRTLKHGAFKS